MGNLTQEQLAALIANVVSQVMQGQTAAPKASPFLAKGEKAAPTDLAAKDAAILAAFKRRGFTDVVLMDRTNPDKPYNVRSFQGWLQQGRIVRKGKKGVRGLFTLVQTDLLPGKAAAKPTITAETKAVFDAAKKAFKSKKAKAQATLPLA